MPETIPCPFCDGDDPECHICEGDGESTFVPLEDA